jgi:hypothetical protein
MTSRILNATFIGLFAIVRGPHFAALVIARPVRGVTDDGRGRFSQGHLTSRVLFPLHVGITRSEDQMAKKAELEPGKGQAAPTRSAVDAFTSEVAKLPPRPSAGGRGRLLFAMDATASREPTWDLASAQQGEMFLAAGEGAGLEVRLAFYRGFDEFKVSRWTAEGRELARLMSAVRCLAGRTQIARVLRYAAEQRRESRVDAVVFVGDCCEEDADEVGHEAGQLGLLGLPVFVFQEGHDRAASRLFPQIAKLTRGAYCTFDRSSPEQLRRLLGAVAAYAAGGRPALLKYGREQGGAAALLTSQMK